MAWTTMKDVAILFAEDRRSPQFQINPAVVDCFSFNRTDKSWFVKNQTNGIVNKASLYTMKAINYRLRIALFAALLFYHSQLIYSALPEHSRKSHSHLNDFLETRCNQNGGKHGVWVYEGTLYDPMTGQPIAAVEGLEMIRRLSRPLISTPTKAESVLIRRLFAYRDLEKEKGWLQSFKLRPTSPKRIIPLNQAATAYDMAVTYVPDPAGNDESKWYIHAQWPDGQSLWSAATVDHSTDNNLRITTFARPRSKPHEAMLPPWQLNNQQSSSSTSATPTPRRQLIQFGGNSVTEKRFGAQETYRYIIARQSSTTTSAVDYTRYGEGPVWYGRYCTLQLKGRPTAKIPSALMSLSQRIPGFWSTHGPVEDDEKAMQSFSQGSLLMRITDEDEQATPEWKNSLFKLAGRVRKASVWRDRMSSR
ncbi:hypothetical protein FisN_23Lh008 [Fistulifera solaris]|uniref:Uncharacterized protein n=1 Tax=Fistulifera solaris TaxID=1519565 RepID=A0A1Z5KJL6_FISSO|nr:hypothetical protein FisN_23Lh008 [Fistulifera solaris]|eukprot:GAX26483.1 hypothetical protein FisN_23Lh008 [Fistulifera solaris]